MFCFSLPFLSLSLLHAAAMHAAAVGSTRGAAAAFTAMMETHKDFEEALDLVFDGPADVLVGTRVSPIHFLRHLNLQ